MESEPYRSLSRRLSLLSSYPLQLGVLLARAQDLVRAQWGPHRQGGRNTAMNISVNP